MCKILLSTCLLLVLTLTAIPLAAQDKPKGSETPTKEEQARISNIKKGLVEYNEKWISQKEYDKIMAAEKAKYIAEDQKAKDLLGPEYRLEYVEGFLVRTNVPPADCKLFFQILVDFRKQFIKDFGKALQIRSMEIPFDVYFFMTREDYVRGVPLTDSRPEFKAKAVPLVAAMPAFCCPTPYPSTSVGIFMYRNTRDKTQYDIYIPTIMHEFIHGCLGNRILMKFTDNTIGPAFDEGLAIYFMNSFYNEKSRSFTWGTMVYYVSEWRNDQRGIPIGRILLYSHDEFYSSDRENLKGNYAQAEAFVEYLMNYSKGKYRANVLKYISSFNNAEETEPDRAKRLEKCIGIPITQMDEEYRKYTAEQRK